MGLGEGSNGDKLERLFRELTEGPAEVGAVMSTATSVLSQIRPATWVAVVMESNAETSRVVASDGTAPAMAAHVDAYVAALDRPHRAPNVGLSKQVIESGDPLLIPSMQYSELLDRLSPAGQDFLRASPPPFEVEAVGVLIVPMRVGGSTIGTLGAFDWRQHKLLNETDLQWLQLAADVVGLSIEHARLAANARQMAERLDLIHAITLANTLTGDLPLTMRMIVEQVTARSGIDAADILLVTEQGTRLEVAASAGFRSPSQPGHQIPVDPVGSPVVRHRLHVHDIAALDRNGPNTRRTQFEREGFRKLVKVPLYTRNGKIGVLELFNRSFVEWDQNWLNFFDTLGAVSGLVIEGSSRKVVVDSVFPPKNKPKLSDLELDILRLIVDGLTNREIAARVHRSENTVKFHVRRILEESGATNRTELARHATREGWL